MSRLSLLIALLAALLAGCSTPIGVVRVSTQEAHRTMSVNALTADAPSAWSSQVLHRNSLFELHKRDPVAALEALYKLVLEQPVPDNLFALSELSFLHARNFEKRDYHLAAAVLAYAFLLPKDERSSVHPLDPRGRLAVDIYNQALVGGFASLEGDEIVLEAGTYRLPFGSLSVTIDPTQFEWAGYRLKRFVPVGYFNVRGLRNRYRQPGVGAPLVAEVEPAGSGAEAQAARKRIPERAKVPATVFMRIKDPLKGVLDGYLSANLELYTTDDTAKLHIGGYDVPLEFESTAAIAYQLEGAPVWNSEISGFRFAEAPVLGDGLVMLQPYRPGRIPVVFVHGTASSPARWAEMYNELANDPVLGDRYQFWLFQYNTGQPVLYSAMLLRRALQASIAEVDPARRDAALRRLVIVGHSQGGLLARLMAVRSGNHFWGNVSGGPLEEVDVPEDTRALLREALFFEPLADLDRVVFIATPHRGSFLAVGWIRSLVRRLITMPARLAQGTQPLQTLPQIADSGIDVLPTSVDNMSPGGRFMKTLAEVPIDPRIKAHSIIAVDGVGPPEVLDDGVVEYRSAHIVEARSERVVRSTHSTQSLPETIEEVRRILREHLGADAGRKPE
ncbi:MAG TPA: alpha/beta fold hydrolase [Ramlibacter sp.]|nr:alpha/beta fold hydrolase [Ramlibacter sp.]